jgi:hypothetical protein
VTALERLMERGGPVALQRDALAERSR